MKQNCVEKVICGYGRKVYQFAFGSDLIRRSEIRNMVYCLTLGMNGYFYTPYSLRFSSQRKTRYICKTLTSIRVWMRSDAILCILPISVCPFRAGYTTPNIDVDDLQYPISRVQIDRKWYGLLGLPSNCVRQKDTSLDVSGLLFLSLCTQIPLSSSGIINTVITAKIKVYIADTDFDSREGGGITNDLFWAEVEPKTRCFLPPLLHQRKISRSRNRT